MSSLSAYEQYLLELINRARMDPAGAATALGINLNQGLPAGKITTASKQVLAPNDLLQTAADNHSNWMLVNDQFSNQEPANFPSGRTGLTPVDRMTAAGYTFDAPPYYGENISWAGGYFTAPQIYRQMFLSPTQRTNLLNATFQEVGVGEQHGSFLRNGIYYDASVVTTDFAHAGNKVFVTGVLYTDRFSSPGIPPDNGSLANGLYDLGEGQAGRSVTGTGGVSDTTGEGGGYALAFTQNQGPVAITLSADPDDYYYPGGPNIVTVAVTIGSSNIKLDVSNFGHVFTNTTLVAVSGVTSLTALGIDPLTLIGGDAAVAITGNKAGNILVGGGGGDYLNGLGGNDLMRGQGGADRYYVDSSGDIVDETGGDGVDTVFATASFSLVDPAHARGAIENLFLAIGSPAIVANGNSIDNRLVANHLGNNMRGFGGNDTIIGLSGNDRIYGDAGNDMIIGGWGNDILTGGPGTDTFRFDGRHPTLTRDTITDFTPADDTFQLLYGVFYKAGLSNSPLSPAYFKVGPAATDANDRIIYNKATGALFYDEDGTGALTAMQLAMLPNKPTLTSQDFFIVLS